MSDDGVEILWFERADHCDGQQDERVSNAERDGAGDYGRCGERGVAHGEAR